MKELIEKATTGWTKEDVKSLKETMRMDWAEGEGFERVLNGGKLDMPDFMSRRLMWIGTLAFLAQENYKPEIENYMGDSLVHKQA